MNQSFINVYSQLIHSQTTSSMSSERISAASMQDSTKLSHPAPAGLWLAHGDEPLMSQWLVEALRPHWQQQGQNVTRIELVSAKTWLEVLTELNSLSLFSPANAIIVTGNHKPDQNTQQALFDFASNVAQQTQNNPAESQSHLLWITPKQDKRALKAKWIQPFHQQGTVIDCNLYNEQQRQQILQRHATRFGLSLSHDAWEMLMADTQNHLLSAYQTLWRLADLFAPQIIDHQQLTINAEQLQSALVSEASYTIYDLSDAMLAGNTQQAITILNGLQTTGEPPLKVLWTVSKDMRLIQQIHSGKKPQEIGIWSSKQRLYSSASKRIMPQKTDHWSQLLFNCDQAVKGVIKQPIWELLLLCTLEVCGVKLFAQND